MARRLGHKGVTMVPFAGGKGLFFVETLEEAVSLHKSRFIRIKGGITVLLRRWSPKENSEIKGKFKEGWIDLRGLPFHLWSEVHLKKIMEQWGTVTEIDWRTLKFFYLSKARVRVVMKERSVLPTLIEVLDGGWDFTISVAVVGKEDGMQVREIGESTRHLAEAHSGTAGRKREDEDRSTAGKGSSAGAVDRTMEWRGGQKAKNAPGRTRGTNRMKVGNSWPPTFFSSNLKSLRAGGAGPRQASRVKAQSNLVDEIWASKHLSRAQSFSKPRPLSETDVGWKREVPRKGPIQLMGQELGGKQDRLSKGPSHRATHSAKGKAKVGYKESENQRKGSTVKCGSKKLWNVLLPSSSACRQGDRSREEPFTTERSPTGSDTLPLEDAFEAGTQLV